MKEFIQVMKALSDPGRVKIIKMLETREMCVCEIQATLGLSQPTVSKHLKILEDAGLVLSRKEGQWVNYRLEPTPANQFADTMLIHLRQWLTDSAEVQALLSRARQVERRQLCKTSESPQPNPETDC